MSGDPAEYAQRTGMEALELLQQPDPEPDLLPALRPDLELQEQTAGHLIRAILKADSSVEALEKQRDADLLAWNQMIQVQKDRVASWRACVRDWMLRHEVTKLQHPYFTASIGKGRTKIVVDDEGKCIAVCRGMKATEAVRVIEKLDKKEFDTVWNSMPKVFGGIAHEETGEPMLLIRRREK